MRTHILLACGRHSRSSAAFIPAVTASGPSPPPEAFWAARSAWIFSTELVNG